MALPTDDTTIVKQTPEKKAPLPLGGIAPPQPPQPATAGPTGPSVPAAPLTNPTPDPMAFAPAPVAPAPVASPFEPQLNANGTYTTAANTPDAGLFGGDTNKINEYWAKQGSDVSGAGAVPFMQGTSPDAQKAGIDAYTAKLRGGSDSDVAAKLATLGLPGGDPANTAAQNAAVAPFNAQTAATDQANNIASIKAAGGIYSPADLGPGVTIGGDFWKGMKDEAGNAVPLDANGQPVYTNQSTPIALPGNGRTIPLAPGGPGGMRPGGPPTGTPGNPTAGALPPLPLGSIGGPSPTVAPTGPQSATTGPNAGVGLTETDPANSLISKTIAPNNAVDRVKTFQDSLQSTIDNVLNPAFNARQRDQNRYNFGAGRGVSGMARTSQGDIVSDYGRQIKDLAAQGLAGATTGSIDDLYKNIGIAQQQQGFQKGLSDTAFNQNVTAAQLEDQLTNSAAGRALQQTLQGFGMDPSQIALLLAKFTGDQSSAAGQAAAGAFGQAGQNAGSSTGTIPPELLALIMQQLGGGAGSGTGTQDYIPE